MENMEGRQLAIRTEPTPLISVAEALFKSGMFPQVRNTFGAFAIIQYGSELGIGPMTSLQCMAIVQGKICMSAQMMLSLAIKAGVVYKIEKDTAEECKILFKRGQIEYLSSFSILEAKQAQIFKEQSGWSKYPRDMLFWRAVTRGLRRVCPDVVLGLYAIEELQEAPPIDSEIIQETPDHLETEKMPEQTKPEENNFYLELYEGMHKAGNITELKDWFEKNKPKILSLPEDQKKTILEAKDFLKKKYQPKEEKNNGNNA